MNDRSVRLRGVAQRVADALPADAAEEVVLTGSVSRGTADEVSDVEMLVVTPGELALEACFELARGAGLDGLGSWGQQGGPARRVSGYREDVPFELVWWPRAFAEAYVDGIFTGGPSSSADALVHGVPLRTRGLLERWQARLADYPDALAAARIEDAALTWGGFAPAGLLTIARPGETFSRLERMLDDALRVQALVYALNRVWQPTTKRLAVRTADLAVKPDRLAERIEAALTEPDPRRALLLMTELQADAVALAPDGPNVVRARAWLAEARRLLED